MGKVDQGVITLWVARHVFRGALRYIGYGGTGKQVRDILHIDDLFTLLSRQLGNMSAWDGTPYNVGGGLEVSTSLKELTAHCEALTGSTLEIGSDPTTSPVDIPIYLSDTSRAFATFDWKPELGVENIIGDIHQWIIENRDALARLF